MRLIVVSLLLLHAQFVFAQKPAARLHGQQRIDSLLKELPRQKEDTNKVVILFWLSYYECGTDPEQGIKYGNEALELAEKLNWKIGIGKAKNSLGLNYSRSDKNKAIECFEQALKIHEEIGYKSGIAKVSSNLGDNYFSVGEYPKALEVYFKALKTYEESGRKIVLDVSIINRNISLIYDDLGDYNKALEYAFKALKMDEGSGDSAGIAANICNISKTYGGLGDYVKAQEYNFKALNIYKETGDKPGIARIMGNIGDVYNDMQNYSMALDYEYNALKMNKELASKYEEANNLATIGQIYLSIVRHPVAKPTKVTGATELAENKYHPVIAIPAGKAALLNSAIDFLQRASDTGRKIANLVLIQICYKDIADAYELKGDYKKALEASNNYHAISDSLFSKENKEKILKMEIKNQYDQQRITDSLKTVEKEHIGAIELQKQKTYSYLGIAGILLLAGLTFFVTRNRNLLAKEKKRSDNLLLNILPEEVADQLKDTGKSAARQFDNVTVLFTDFVNFTEASGRMKPEALIEELDTCFKKFDAITGEYGVEKIKTVGDAYLAVCGLPTPDAQHAENIVRAAQEINAFMRDREAKMGNSTFKIRIGIHTGSVIAGIVGDKKFAYDIWGDTVNTAARMEQNSEAGRINISEATFELVKDKINCTYRGEIDAKGKGMMKMYYVVSI